MTELNFSDLIREVGGGDTNTTATERLHEIVLACRETGKKGSITVKISIEISATGVVEFHPAMKHSKPESPLLSGTYYATKGGEIVDEDPEQTELPGIRAVRSM